MNIDDSVSLESTWPATTTTGEPRIQRGSMLVSRDPDGSVTLTGMIGDDGAPPADCEPFQLVLGPEQARELRAFLTA